MITWAGLYLVIKQVAATVLISTSMVMMILMDSTEIYQALRKVELVLFGCANMFFGKDKKYEKRWKKLPDPKRLAGAAPSATKRVIFIRHGESLWNEVFNKSKLPHKFLPRLVKAVLKELGLAFKNNSVFFDSPLNGEGVDQAKELRRFLAKETTTATADVQALRGAPDAPPTVIASSNLRRAAQTACIALWDRLQLKKEPVHVLSQLQEISTNVDTIALAPTGMVPELPNIESQVGLPPSAKFFPQRVFNAAANTGNKPVLGNGYDRMRAFATWACAREEEVVVVAGHSLWFRAFFRVFIDRDLEYVGKDKKMENGGAVGFTLVQCAEPGGGGAPAWRILPGSMEVIYAGFAKK